MLIGSTFAWFTDSASTGVNKIQSGNLDIEAYYQNSKLIAETGDLTINMPPTFSRSNQVIFEQFNENQKLDGNVQIINEDKWEPGKVGARLITVKNKGNLDAKVKLDFDTVDDGLESALWFDFIMINEDNNAIGNFEKKPMSSLQTVADYTGYLPLNSNSELRFIFVYGMDESAGNEYKEKSFSAKVYINATQLNFENDSFGPDYDKNAPYAYHNVSSVQEFVEALNSDEEYTYIYLNSDTVVSPSDYLETNDRYFYFGGSNKKEVVIDGFNDNNNYSLTFNTSTVFAINPDKVNLTFKNLTINSSNSYDSQGWSAMGMHFDGKVIMENVQINNRTVILDSTCNAFFKNVKFNFTETPANFNDDAYAMWLMAGANVTLDACDMESYVSVYLNRAIKISDEDVTNPKMAFLAVSGTTFKSQKKAAVLVASTAGANIVWGSGNSISNVQQDVTNAVWVDEDRSAYDSLVTVSGCTKIIES